jgi:adenosine deaminase
MLRQTNRATWALAWIVILACIGALPSSARENERVADRFEALRDDPVLLRRFLSNFPKGGDLHNHLDGAVYAENLIKWAAEDGKCIELESGAFTAPPCSADDGRPTVSSIQFDDDVVNSIIDALSTRNYERRPVSGHNQFFSTFEKIMPATIGREGDMLAEISARAARQNLLYVELMQSWPMGSAMALAERDTSIRTGKSLDSMIANDGLTQLVDEALEQTDRIEQRRNEILRCNTEMADPGCNVTIRYLAQVIRTLPRNQVLAQTLLAFRLVQADERYVGLNFVSPEDHPFTLANYEWQMSLVGGLADILPDVANGIALHAGELTLGLVPPEHLGWHIREAVYVAKAKRIGHGTDIAYDSDAESLLDYMAMHGILVEINVTSAEVILGVKGNEHPYALYKRHNVPMALSTDDEGVSRIDITNEYKQAVEMLGIGYSELKELSRNSLQYSFLSGGSLFDDYRELRVVEPCRKDLEAGRGPGSQCRLYLEESDKAAQQWSLEQRFVEFEGQFE